MLSKNFFVFSGTTKVRGYLFVKNVHPDAFLKSFHLFLKASLQRLQRTLAFSGTTKVRGYLFVKNVHPLTFLFFCFRYDYSVTLNTKASNHMAKTNYRKCWWLIQVVDGEFGAGSYRKGTGYSMRNLNDLRPIGERIDWITSHERDMIIDEDILKNKEQFRQTMMRWRTTIYNEFGLAIMQESTSGTDRHGNGGYYYYLANPELLDEEGKTLRDHIQFLAKSEKDRGDWVSLTDMTARFTGGSSSLGFLSAGGPSTHGYLSQEGTSYRTILGEENLELIQFAMQFGEVLTIEYGKVRAGIDISQQTENS